MLPQIELLSRLGICLLQVQATEHVIKLVMQIVLPNQALTIEQFQALEEKERNKTLGYFLTQLRGRVAVAPSFDEDLRVFLRQRNMFAHNLSEVPGWDPGTDEGRRACIAFLDEFYKRTSLVLKVFSGLVRAWEKESKLGFGEDTHEFFAEIDKIYMPIAQFIFTAKGD